MKKPLKLLFILPNLFTVSSIACGIYSMIVANGSQPDRFFLAAVAILFAGLFDAADGRVARITRTQSEFGVQLDSLADVISFGAAPALLVYQWALEPYGWLGMTVVMLYVVAGALRLARFNLLSKYKTNHFVGLPIPLAAAALSSLVMLHHRTIGGGELTNQPLLLVVVVVLALLMVSTFPYRTYKKIQVNVQNAVLLLLVIGGVTFATFLTSFSLILVAVIGLVITLGPAEVLVRLLRERLARAPKRN